MAGGGWCAPPPIFSSSAPPRPTPFPPRSVDGVKRRVNAGMGRCQGGFCGPRVVEILSREGKVPPTEVLQDGVGTNLLTGETKMGGRE